MHESSFEKVDHEVMWYSCYNVSDVGVKPFKLSVLQSQLQNHSKFEFEKDPYACLLPFTHFKMVKHENKLHIHNPCIFMIILDILFVQFGVRIKKLLNFKV